MENVIFVVGDTATVNQKLAKILQVPLIGCGGSHRFNLADSKILQPYKPMLRKVKELMKKLSRKTARWTSTYTMVSRYFKIKEFIDRDDADLAPFISSGEYDFKLKTFFGDREKVNSITLKLQSEACTLLDMGPCLTGL